MSDNDKVEIGGMRFAVINARQFEPKNAKGMSYDELKRKYQNLMTYYCMAKKRNRELREELRRIKKGIAEVLKGNGE